MSQSELFNRMAVLLGGRAAESVVYGEVSTGAADDLTRATDIARNMVVRFGMVPALGQVVYEPETASYLGGQVPNWRPRAYGNEAADAIDGAVKGLIEKAFELAHATLERNRSVLETGAHQLLDHETLGTEDLAKLGAALVRDPKPVPTAMS
jgi:cell division protease FtsH